MVRVCRLSPAVWNSNKVRTSYVFAALAPRGQCGAPTIGDSASGAFCGFKMQIANKSD